MTPRNQAGFTLLELLVAITILSLLLVALSDGVHFAGRAWRAQEDRIQQQGDVNAVQTVLRAMLASGQSFVGSPQDLKFVGRLPEALARGGLYDIELSSDSDRLVLTWRPHFKGASSTLEQNSASLLAGIAGLDLSYFLGTQGWQRVANGKDVNLITIKAELSGGRVWPALTIAPVINVSSQEKKAKS